MSFSMKTEEEIYVDWFGSDSHTTRKSPSKNNIIGAINEGIQQSQPQWIKIESEEDLHNINSHCWVCTRYGGVYSYQAYTSIFPSLHNISHYMPIIKPEPPKED